MSAIPETKAVSATLSADLTFAIVPKFI